MLISIHGPSGAFECDWVRLALFRDNVQHHLENGQPSARFAAIHELADAIYHSAGRILSARRLRMELALVWDELARKPISELAMSLRTRATLSCPTSLPTARGTVLVRFSDWEPPFHVQGARTLSAVFFKLMFDIERITRRERGSDVVHVFPPLPP